MVGAMAIALLVFMTGGAFADELGQTGAVTPDIMDKFTNLGLAMLVAHMWSKDADRKDLFIKALQAEHKEFVKNLQSEHKEAKDKLIDLIKDLRSRDD